MADEFNFNGLRDPNADKGPKGDKGDKGDPGEAGADGVQGIQGPRGIQGAIGPAGPTGPTGTQGETGPAGPAGPQGKQGVAGPAGAKGDIGPAGPIGPQGTKGEPGASAYEVAVNSGYNGTQEAWLASLKGAQGPRGIQGSKGDAATDQTPQRTTWSTLELNQDVNESASYIDFHTANLGNDYDTRIISTGGTKGSNGIGTLNFKASAVSWNDKQLATRDDVQSTVTSVIDTNVATAVKDTQSVNNPPSWYFTNYPLRVLTEFKQLASIGVTAAMLPPSQTSTYGLLTTKVPFPDSSGGFPVQEVDITQSARPAKLIRKGISTSSWSAWELMTTG